MTSQKFISLLKKIDPNFNIRFRGYTYCGGIFYKNKYIARIDKGELTLFSFRTKEGMKRRRRHHLVQLLHRYEWIKPKDRKALIWGLS